MSYDEGIKQEIFHLVREYYKINHKKKTFIPGTSVIPYAGRVFDEKELISLVDSSLDFWLTTGHYAKEFEKRLAEFIKIKYCMLTNSGSSANLLAVSALTSEKLGKKRLLPGDEVVTTACGFPTTLNPIIQNNLIPVFIDVDLGTGNIQAEKIEAVLTDKTKAIIIPHTLGNPSDLETIMSIVNRHNLWFIEDNCDALGSQFDGKYTGTFGHMSTCSFYPAHHITMGEGGAVLTNDPILRKIIISFRDWGRDCWCEPGCDNSCQKRFSWQLGELPFGYDHKYIYSHIGYNLKLTDMQAAIGVEQLKKLPEFIQKRQDNFNYFYQELEKYKSFFSLPSVENKATPSWFGFPILIRDDAPFTRDEIVFWLEQHNISTRMLFGGNLLKQPAYIDIKCRVATPLDNTDKIMKDLFWIGVYPGLTHEMLQYILDVFHSFFKDM